MSLEYVGLKEINGPLIVLDHVKDAAYEEMVDIVLDDGSHRRLRATKPSFRFLKAPAASA